MQKKFPSIPFSAKQTTPRWHPKTNAHSRSHPEKLTTKHILNHPQNQKRNISAFCENKQNGWKEKQNPKCKTYYIRQLISYRIHGLKHGF